MAMIYPTALIIIGTAASVSLSIMPYLSMKWSTRQPYCQSRWFAGLRWIHQTLGWWLSAFAMGAFRWFGFSSIVKSGLTDMASLSAFLTACDCDRIVIACLAF